MGKMYSETGGRMHGIKKDGDFNTPYGKDSSDVNIKRSTVESAKWGGGVDNVEHSLGATKGPSAQAPTKSKNSS